MGKFTVIYLFPILLSFFLYKNPDWLLLIAPIPLDDYLLRIMHPPRSNPNDPNYWAQDPLLSELRARNISDKADIFHPKGYPTLVHDYVKADYETLYQQLLEANRGKQIRTFDFTNASVENHFSNCAGHKYKQETKVNMPYEEFAERMKSSSYLYGGFETLTSIDAINGILDEADWKTLRENYQHNNMFFSNFPKKFITAAFHCASIDSLSIQLAGRKTWFLVSPEQLAKVSALPMPTYFPFGLNDDQMIEAFGNMIVTTVGPGDALYFGPNWCHSVITHPEPNLMLNLRYYSKEKFLQNPRSLIMKMLWRQLTRSFGQNPQENLDVQGPIYGTVNNLYEDCGKSNRLEELVSRFS